MNEKGKEEEPSGSNGSEDMSNFKWPPFFDQDEVRFLVQRVHEAASNEVERRVFLAILRRAYEDVIELEILYRELPGVLADDHASTDNFRKVLNRAGARGRRINSSISDTSVRFAYDIPNPGPLGRGPCQARFLIKPTAILLIREGINRIAQGRPAVYDRYTTTLRGLWRQASYLERFHAQALRGTEADGRDRLAEDLALIGRDSRVTGRMPGLEPSDIPGREEPPPDLDGFWPPPFGQEPLDWPPEPGPDPELPHDFCDLVSDLCQSLVIDGLGRISQLPTSVNADGITSISPPSACAGQSITLHGSGFGASQPSDVVVLIGGVVAQVASWSDTAIVVTVPANARSGCIGFRNETIEAQRRVLHQINQQTINDINTGLRCLGTGESFPNLPYLAESPPCTGFNYFPAPLADIDWFHVNGRVSIIVEPHTALMLTWQVTNATTVNIQRISADGPPINVTNPPGNVLNLGAFTEMRPVRATYQLTATTACGTVTRTVSADLRRAPALRILGIEVIQAIQRFSLTNPAQNNSVRLVANKRTMARVYVDSGITDGFDYGAGRNHLADVTGEVIISPAGGNTVDAGAPLNVGGVITARPAAQINRGDQAQTLNFELPFDQLSGDVRIEARVQVLGGGNQFGGLGVWTASDTSTRVTFQSRRSQIVVRIFVQDDNLGLLPPTTAQYDTSLQGARTRYSIAENGFVIHIAPGFEVIRTQHNLTMLNGWQDLLDDIDEVADDFEDWNQIWTALVPNDGRYNVNGLGTVGGVGTGGAIPAFVARAALPATFGHEMGHNFGFRHAPCGALAPGEVPDGRLPAATEDIGMDVSQRQLIAAGQAELLCAGGPQTRWPSIAFWDVVFDALA